ncbi:prohormone-1-like protein, partial [Dinothrombium tinctorium]
EEQTPVENILLNYLLARQLERRLPSVEFQDQKKRSYWKQCAFNAVTCFGRKR